VAVNPHPVSQAGPDLLDQLSANIPLAANTPPSDGTGTWTKLAGPAGSFSNIHDPNATFHANVVGAIYVLRWTLTNPCGTNSDDLYASYCAMPTTGTLSGSSNVCTGQNYVQYNASIPNANSYEWFLPYGASGSSSSSNIYVSFSTIATSGMIKVVGSNLCGSSDTLYFAVNVTTAPGTPVISSNSPVCEHSSLFLTADTILGATYQWTGPYGFNSSSQNPELSSVILANEGSYSVIANINGCQSQPVSIHVSINSLPLVI